MNFDIVFEKSWRKVSHIFFWKDNFSRNSFSCLRQKPNVNKVKKFSLLSSNFLSSLLFNKPFSQQLEGEVSNLKIKNGKLSENIAFDLRYFSPFMISIRSSFIQLNETSSAWKLIQSENCDNLKRVSERELKSAAGSSGR